MIKKLSTFSFLLFTLLLLSINAKAQNIYFCEDVDRDGYPITESAVFNISSGGGYLDVLVRLPYTVNCSSVRYEIYKEDSYGHENYSTTITQDTQRDWVWFYKQITFYDSGRYNVYVYDCSDYMLTSGSVRIQFR
jgi:hypothetical protein